MAEGKHPAIARRDAFAELKSIIDGLSQGGDYVLVLNEYQRANLLGVLVAAGIGSVYTSPLSVINTGDWAAEVRYLLGATDYKPNVSAEDLAQRARDWRQ